MLRAVSGQDTPARRNLFSFVVEGTLIVASVLLGFAVAQYGENRSDAALRARALASLQQELEHNLAAVEPYIEFHRTHLEALRKADAGATGESGYEVYIRVRSVPEWMKTDVPIVRTAAWEAASSSGALRLLDYGVIAGLAEVYQMQNHLGTAIDRIPMSTPAFFDPAMGAASVRLSQAAVSELLFAEQSLVALYKKQLDALRATSTR
jgi:hypothetical protein